MMPHAGQFAHGRGRRAFSLVELVIVVVIMGILAGIAVPRLSSAADNTRKAALGGNLDHIQKATDFYSAEHAGRGPGTDPGGAPTAVPKDVVRRLMGRTDENGNVGPGGLFGPYLRSWPANPINGKLALRVDGALPGAGTHGWRYDTATDAIAADHAAGQRALAETKAATTIDQVPD